MAEELNPNYTALLDGWKKKNLSIEQVREELYTTGYDDQQVRQLVKAYKKLKYGGRQELGVIILIAGSLIGFLSFILSYLNLFPSFFGATLYGLISVSILMIVGGFYLIFE
jgi:hypothetical protein